LDDDDPLLLPVGGGELLLPLLPPMPLLLPLPPPLSVAIFSSNPLVRSS
jgi:hypothetical protein